MKTQPEKSIFIHIGPHKTGTTTIQTGLRLNQDALKKAGYLVPQSGRINEHSAGHHALNKKVPNSERVYLDKNVWREIELEIQNHPKCSNVILTAELFSLLPYNEIEIFSQLLQAYQVYIIIYLRRQDKLYQSLWSMLIKNPRGKKPPVSFSEYIENGILAKKRSVQWYYEKLMDSWGNIFGFDHLIPRVLEKKFLQGHLFHDFLSACQVENPTQFELPPDRNVTPGPKTLAALYTLKKHLLESVSSQTLAFMIKCVDRYANTHNWNQQRLNLIDQATYSNLMERFQASNQNVARKFFQRDQLFLEPFEESELTPCDASTLSDEQLKNIFLSHPLNMVFTQDLVDRIFTPGLNQKERKKIDRDVKNIQSSAQWKEVYKITQA